MTALAAQRPDDVRDIHIRRRVQVFCAWCGPAFVVLLFGGWGLLGGLIPQARFFSIIILVINFGLYVATTIYSMRASGGQAATSIDGRTLFDFGAKYPPALAAGQTVDLLI